MKFTIRAVINEELLLQELNAKSTGAIALKYDAEAHTVTVLLADETDLDHARAVLAAHDPKKMTKSQKRARELEEKRRDVRAVLGPKLPHGYEDFADMSVDRLRQVVYLLWLDLEEPGS